MAKGPEAEGFAPSASFQQNFDHWGQLKGEALSLYRALDHAQQHLNAMAKGVKLADDHQAIVLVSCSGMFVVKLVSMLTSSQHAYLLALPGLCAQEGHRHAEEHHVTEPEA
jgi:hypothetical protein